MRGSMLYVKKKDLVEKKNIGVGTLAFVDTKKAGAFPALPPYLSQLQIHH